MAAKPIKSLEFHYTIVLLCVTVFQAKLSGIMPGTGTALEVHVRGVDKVNGLKTSRLVAVFTTG